MLIVHGTRKLLDRVGRPTATPDDRSSTSLGSWYATVLFWKPQVALFVNETTLLPVLLPFAPARTVVDRFRASAEQILTAHGLSRSFAEAEIAEMTEHRLATTKNRSVAGVMNEFAHLGEAYRQGTGAPDLADLSMRLSQTPCGPLYGSHVSPDRELAELARQQGVVPHSTRSPSRR